jgi:RNA polymerase sigma-70 factor (ECF subfamily)
MVAMLSSPTPSHSLASLACPCPDRLSAGQSDAQYDAVLVRRFNAGEAAAFDEIVARHRKKMLAVAFDRLRNHADAEEIAQETFVRAFHALPRFRGESSLATWLHRIANNLALNRYWYSFRRRQHVTQSLDRARSEDNPATLADVIASEAPSPVDDAMNREFSELVEDCVCRLGPDHREILRLRNGLNYSYDQIALALGLNIGTVKSRIARAREDLRALVAETCPEFGLVVSCGG